jgi:hypothetical protein
MYVRIAAFTIALALAVPVAGPVFGQSYSSYPSQRYDDGFWDGVRMQDGLNALDDLHRQWLDADKARQERAKTDEMRERLCLLAPYDRACSERY